MAFTLNDLKKKLTEEPLSRVLNKYILGGDSCCFSTNKELTIELKENISKYFGIHLKMTEIVGSGKLGISLSEERFGKPYSKNSDIDIAVVSAELFEKAWSELTGLNTQFYSLKEKDQQFLKECLADIPDGFVSPNKLPERSEFRQHWWKIFTDLSNKEKFEYRKIRGRLFKDWFFAENYYAIQLKKIRKG